MFRRVHSQTTYSECTNAINTTSLILDEGFIITKKKEITVASLNYTCQNPSCGKTFEKPLKAINLSLNSPEPYLACPHCLTEITTQENPSTAETKSTVTAETLKTIEDNVQDEKTTQQPTTPQCTHHFGYLSERSSKEKISDECITCTEIVNCMLKAMKTQQGS